MVWLGDVRLDDGHHPAIHFDDHGRAAAKLCGPDLWPVGHLEYLLGVSLGNPANRALAQDNAVVLYPFVHGLGEGLVGAKAGDCAL